MRSAPGLLVVAFFLLCESTGWAQTKTRIEILNSDVIRFDEAIAKADRLIGNVRLGYKQAIMHCDSAYRYPNGDFEAFSKVRIVQGDSLRLFGDRLYLTNADKKAKLRDNIRLTDKDRILTTEILDYDLETGVASYFDGGKIVSTQNDNVLTSREGYYDSESEFFHFRKEVLLKNPDYEVRSDTLKYSAPSETAFFFGPTTILTDDTEIDCRRGWYNTITEVCQFTRHARIRSRSTYLEGDSIYFEGKRGFGEVFQNVAIRDTTSNYLITGDYGWHDDQLGESLVTDRAEMVQFFGEDSLFLHADTLRALPDSGNYRRIRAFQRVKFYKNDLQGKADSLTYAERDSTLRLFGDPVLWSADNQISGDQVDIRLFSGVIDRMDIYGNAFIISEAAPESYNQIKGRNLTGYFSDNELRKIHVKGNGQTVYYPVEEGENGNTAVGVNRADCSNVMIYVKDNDIQRVALIDKPSGGLHPLFKASENDKLLDGFFWETENRPRSRDDIFNWTPTDQAVAD